jgi:HEPN domain-containing protein
MKNKDIISEWLKRARSNLERARAEKISDEILYEDLCFDAQQAVEKSLKALLVRLDKPFPKTHSIGMLLKLIEETGVEISDDINRSKILTDYAVDTRYPGMYEPVSEEEYKRLFIIFRERRIVLCEHNCWNVVLSI